MTLPKTESFQPLTTATATDENRPFRVTVLPKTPPAAAFQNLGQMVAAAAETKAAHGRNSCEPQLTVQREGERITGFRIQCGCGQVMEVACDYDEPAKVK
jgi:hypothetical protein